MSRLGVNGGMKSSQRVNTKVAAIENDNAAKLLRNFVLVGFAVASTAFFVELAIAAILGLF
jgi:hypothetical protein